MHSPLRASQMETVLSEEAVQRLLLNGCQHTSFTESTWPLHAVCTSSMFVMSAFVVLLFWFSVQCVSRHVSIHRHVGHARKECKHATAIQRDYVSQRFQD